MTRTCYGSGFDPFLNTDPIPGWNQITRIRNPGYNHIHNQIGILSTNVHSFQITVIMVSILSPTTNFIWIRIPIKLKKMGLSSVVSTVPLGPPLVFQGVPNIYMSTYKFKGLYKEINYQINHYM